MLVGGTFHENLGRQYRFVRSVAGGGSAAALRALALAVPKT